MGFEECSKTAGKSGSSPVFQTGVHTNCNHPSPAMGNLCTYLKW